MVMLYFPGSTLGKLYLPVSFVVSVLSAFVARSVIVTVAPATAAPDGSVTVPETYPVPAVCPYMSNGLNANRRTTPQKNGKIRLAVISHPPVYGPSIWTPPKLRMASNYTAKRKGPPAFLLQGHPYTLLFNEKEPPTGPSVHHRKVSHSLRLRTVVVKMLFLLHQSYFSKPGSAAEKSNEIPVVTVQYTVRSISASSQPPSPRRHFFPIGFTGCSHIIPSVVARSIPSARRTRIGPTLISSRSTAMKRFSVLLVATLFLAAYSFADNKKEVERVENSGTVMSEILNIPEDIPQDLLDKAYCVIVLPSVVKAAFIVGGSYGRGVMTCRSGENFTGKWGAPTMIALEGGSFGLQIGGQATDFVLLVMNDRGAQGILTSKVKLGADASAAAGPKGREVSAATDATMRAEILSYSRARGVFAGVSLEGSTLRPDNDANKNL